MPFINTSSSFNCVHYVVEILNYLRFIVLYPPDFLFVIIEIKRFLRPLNDLQQLSQLQQNILQGVLEQHHPFLVQHPGVLDSVQHSPEIK